MQPIQQGPNQPTLAQESEHWRQQHLAVTQENDRLIAEVNHLKQTVRIPNTPRITPCTRFWIAAATVGFTAAGFFLYVLNEMRNNPMRISIYSLHTAADDAATSLKSFFSSYDDKPLP